MELAKLISDKEEVAVPDDKGDFIIVTMMMLLMVVAHKTALACLIRTVIVMLSSDKRVDNNYFLWKAETVWDLRILPNLSIAGYDRGSGAEFGESVDRLAKTRKKSLSGQLRKKWRKNLQFS